MRKWPVFQTLALNALMLIYTLAWVLFIGKIVISRTPKQCAPRHLPMGGIVSEWHSHLQVWNIRSISGGLSISYIVPEDTQHYLWSLVISHGFLTDYYYNEDSYSRNKYICIPFLSSNVVMSRDRSLILWHKYQGYD